MNEAAKKSFCQMCGATDRDFWETRPARHAVLSVKLRAGDVSQTWTICDECHEGLLRLSQVRRATIDDQEALLAWLLAKFKTGK